MGVWYLILGSASLSKMPLIGFSKPWFTKMISKLHNFENDYGISWRDDHLQSEWAYHSHNLDVIWLKFDIQISRVKKMTSYDKAFELWTFLSQLVVLV